MSGGLGNPQGWNRYAYVGNDPVNFVDPAGLKACPAFGVCWDPPVRNPVPADPYLGFNWGTGPVKGEKTDPSRNPDDGKVEEESRPECDITDGNNAKAIGWINAHYKDASLMATVLNITTAEVLGLSALESGWATGPFVVGGRNNYFSMHYPAPYANGYVTTSDGKVKVATFDSYLTSAKAFAASYGGIVRGIVDSTAFAKALQDAGVYGINRDGSKVASFVKSTADTIDFLYKRISCTH